MSTTIQNGAPPSWKQFNFFDASPVKDVHDLASPPEIFKKNTPEISVLSSSSTGVLVADIYGSIHILNREFESVKSWVAHVGGRVTHMVDGKGTLITIGEEEHTNLPVLKIWDLTKSDKRNDAPLLLRSVKVQHGTRPHPVSTIALSASLSHLVIGLADGTVLIYRHLDQSLSASGGLTALPKPRVILEASSEPITGLGFREPGDPASSSAEAEAEDGNPQHYSYLYLFIVTTNRVLSYQVTGKGSGGTPTVVVDEIGAGLGCAVMDWRAKNIVVAREEALYVCGTEGKGPSVAYEGHKSSIHTHLNYLVIVSPPFVPTAANPSATVRNFVARTPAQSDTGRSRTDISKVTVFDLENKFVAFSGTFEEGARAVFSQWGCIFVLTNDGKLSRLEEKPTATKLDMIYRRNFYVLALNLAKTQGLDESSVADIHRQYGDHLYSKGDYDGSMQQFVQTIGHLQPSYVIRKFLDAQRIHNLVTYLQDLHTLGLANSDHTTLLLNTYTKLKDVARLDSFIKTESRTRSRSTSGIDEKKDGEDGDDEPPFDLETAIRVCRQAGYFEHASYLAKKYKRHEDYLRIQVEDSANYKDALVYLRRLDSEATESNLARYGRIMLANLPDETTQLLIDICTGATAPSVDSEIMAAPTASRAVGAGSGPSYLSYLALNRGASQSDVPPSPSTITTRPGGDLPPAVPQKPTRQRTGSFHDIPRSGSPSTQTGAAGSSPLTAGAKGARIERKWPSPQQYFSHFVDNMEQFVVFLEAVALRRWKQTVDESVIASATAVVKGGEDDAVESAPAPADPLADKRDQIAVWNTLIELYLTLSEKMEEGRDTLREKTLRVLNSERIPYDPTHALILCSTRNFTEGLVLLWEQLGMHEDVLRFWIDKAHEGGESAAGADASRRVVHHLKLYGPKHKLLYPLVLRFITSSEALLTRHTEDLKEILEEIEREKIMPPLAVIQVLSRNGVTSVGLVKEWLLSRVRESRDEIQMDRQLINSYREETRTKLKQVEELSDPDHPRVFHVTRCSACSGQLDLPSVHFMCNHSYHQRCLAENETECPNCARQHGMLREIRSNNERLAGQHDLFLSEVQEGGFNAVAGAFGRGVMRMTRANELSVS